MREPTIFWGPEIIKPGVVAELGTTMDLLPTFAQMAHAELPSDRIYDGYDISQALSGKGNSPRDVVFYYRGTEVYAVRKGAYKAHFIIQPEYGDGQREILDTPALYNLNVDPSEKYNVADNHPEVIEEIEQVLAGHLKTVVPVENQLEK